MNARGFIGAGILVLLIIVAGHALAQEGVLARGYQAFLKKDYPGAVGLLKGATLSEKHPLKDYERWALGRSLIETNDPKAALPILEALLKEEPQSLLAPPAQVQLGRALLASGDAKKSAEQLQAAIPALPAENRGEALYYLGEALLASGQKEAAIAKLREAYLQYPGSPAEEDILARLEGSQAASFSSSEKLERGILLYDAKKYSKSLETLEGATTGSALARVMKGECLYQLKRYGDAALYLSSAGEGVPAERARPALLHLGISQLRNQEEGAALATLARTQQLYPGSAEGEEALYRIGMIHLQANRRGEAQAAMERLAQDYPRGNFRDKGLWAVAWDAYRKSEWAVAKKFLQLMEQGAADPPTQGKAIYWLGRVAEREGGMEKAKLDWTRAYRASPFSYYGVMALKRLQGIESMEQVPPMPPEWKAAAPHPPAASSDYHFKKALALYKAGLGKESLPEVEASVAAVKERPAVQVPLLEAARKSDAYYLSLLLGQKYWETFKGLFPSPQAAEDYRAGLLYPYAFRAQVERAGREFSVSPYLVVALMRQESGFMPWAVSSANAQGLMQLLPTTAAPRARALGLAGYDLFDPEVNIRLGTSELSNMLQRFGNNWPQAFAAYNAGPGRPKQWNQEFGHLPTDEWIEEIPFSETNLYVKLVLRNYWAYRLLFP